jgi:hypothetical protein
MKRAVLYLLCIFLALSGSLGSIYLAGRTGAGASNAVGAAHDRNKKDILCQTACITKDSSLLDQPDGKEIRALAKGNAVTVLKKESGYSQVQIYVFDTPLNNVGWVPSDVLTTDSGSLDLNEGRLRTDAALWYGPPPVGKAKGYQVRAGTPIMVWEKNGGWAHCFFPGGDDGWVRLKDIEFIGPGID